MSGNGKGAKRKAEKPDKTTVRAKVTADEHDVIEKFAKYRCNITIEFFVRLAIDAQLKAMSGKDLATLAEENKNHGKVIQGDLFD